MKNIYILLILLVTSCTKSPITHNVSFSAAYVSPICMGYNPKTAILEFDKAVITLPVKEVNTGVVSIGSAEMKEGHYKLLSVTVVDSLNKVTSYYANTHWSSWVVVVTGGEYDVYRDLKIDGQLFCDKFGVPQSQVLTFR